MLHKYFSIFFILSFLVTSEAYARQSCDWRFRTSITINETSGSTTSNYSVKLTLTGSSGGNLSTDYDWSDSGDDLRVFDSDDSTSLSFSIASWDASTKTAEVWVTLPVFTANESRSIFIYYDNEDASSIAGTPPTTTYVLDKIKFHTRYNNAAVAANDPDSLASAKALFDAQDDSNTSYGCSHPDEYISIRNSTQAPTTGTSVNFIAYSTTLFDIPSTGTWGVRYGADYGLGGGLYIDGVAMDERWDEDLWWGGSNWNNSDVLTGVTTLSAGEHKLEIIGAEGGNDGGLTIQFRSPDGTWSSDATTLGIGIRSESCPTVRHTIEYGAHDECGVDLSVRGIGADLSVPSVWEKNAPQDITFSLMNTLDGTSTSSSPIDVTVSIPSGFNLIESVGTDWSSCTQVGEVISCQYNNALGVDSYSDSITLTLLPGDGASVGSDDIVIEVVSTFYDLIEANNTASTAITIEDNDVIASVTPSCSPQSGVWARFFKTDGYFSSSAAISNESAMQIFVDDNKNASQLDGQTIFSNINGDENPFNDADTDSNDENFLAIFEGYIKVSATDNYTFAVNGDDAVEFRLGDTVRSAYYGLHGESSTPQDTNTIRLAEGYHSIEYRMQENTGRAAYRLYSSAGTVTLTSTDITPDSYFYHCAGDPSIQITSSVSVTSDDIHGTTTAKAIPNAIIKYTVTGTNQGSISTNTGSTIITQTVDSDNKLFVKDLNGSGEGPIHFTSIDSSGLTYQYDSSAGDDNLWFSIDNGVTYTETIDLTDDYNDSVTHFQIRFDGSLKAKFESTEHSFTFEYQTRVK